jgi:hypothetical protein
MTPKTAIVAEIENVYMFEKMGCRMPEDVLFCSSAWIYGGNSVQIHMIFGEQQRLRNQGTSVGVDWRGARNGPSRQLVDI